MKRCSNKLITKRHEYVENITEKERYITNALIWIMYRLCFELSRILLDR